MTQPVHVHSEGKSVAAWTAVGILIVAAGLLSLGVGFLNLWLSIIGVILVPVAVIVGKVLAMAGFGVLERRPGAAAERGPTTSPVRGQDVPGDAAAAGAAGDGR